MNEPTTIASQVTFSSLLNDTKSFTSVASTTTTTNATTQLSEDDFNQTLHALYEYRCTDPSLSSWFNFSSLENGTTAFLEGMSEDQLSRLHSLIDNHTTFSGQEPIINSSYCAATWDGLSCWMRTMAGHLAVIPCISNLNGVDYDTSKNASRMCMPNGSWAETADYLQCEPLKIDQIPIEHLYTATIYYIGYGLSLCALTVALWIFLYFKDLRCVRNTIHTNLMATYLLIAVCWIITDRLHSNPSSLSRKASCVIVIFLTYLMGTNFFWMFVEGLYLYILVVKTFSIELVKIQNYAFIGWGLPAVFILIWSLTKVYFSRYESMLAECPWQAQDEFDYIYKVPILLVLIINIFFLGKIMWVLIIKLRAATSAESKQYRKAAKALLVLIPLLGVGYMLVLVTPTHSTAKIVFQYLQAILVSTQGFTVAVLYCFCNGEVRNSVRNHFQRFRLRRTLRYGGEYPAKHSTYYRTTAYHQQNANNQRAYGFQSLKANSTGNGNRASGRFSGSSDSARLYRNTVRGDKCRDSCVSFTTTTSYVAPANSNASTANNNHSSGSLAQRFSGTGCDTNTNNGNGYHSIPTTPDNEKLNEQIDIELQQL